MPATSEKLGDLHVLLTKELMHKLRNGEATAQDLNVARQFLRDNRIEATLDSMPMQDLMEGLKTFEDYKDKHV